MTPVAAAALIAGGTLLLSVLTTVAIVAFTYGQLRADVRQLKDGRSELATKGDVRLVELQLAEIKGMFRLELRPGAAGAPAAAGSDGQ